jgi:hypothetical protein
MFSSKDCHKLWSFITLLHVCLIYYPREFPNKHSRLCYAFSYLQGDALEQIIHLVDNDHVNLENFDAFMTSLE